MSQAETFDCADVGDVLAECRDSKGEVTGFGIWGTEPPLHALSRKAYARRLVRLVGAGDEGSRDEHGPGDLRVLGANTCAESDPDKSSHHLVFTLAGENAGRAAAPGATLEDEGDVMRVVGSLEFAKREGRWAIGVIYSDLYENWADRVADPLTDVGCGPVELWGSQ